MERTENTQPSQLHQCPEGFHTIHTPSEGPYLIQKNLPGLNFRVGLSCTSASPDGRSSLRKAPYKLETARQTLFNVESVNCQALT
ncbi:hypothetical protein C1H46_015155 [Malus baccata]|uniref:Uncharacterized protein n=1 Tax=Malus baccata TaxID=106549 RepID=A0A540MKC7_MALBA|nr:hypothetical protein C1H46_015155 [Malus baccata]